MTEPGFKAKLDQYKAAQAARGLEAMECIRDTMPGSLLEWPAEAGQLAALMSPHTYRILIPGNGWGKTTVMGLDCNYLMMRNDPFKPRLMPRRPAIGIWYCMKYQQFEIMRVNLETKCFAYGWRWNGSRNFYEWPNGSRTYVLSSDSDWRSIQGIEPDAVYFDEHPDQKFWTEMMYRRRGQARTRYMVAATMTQGITWFVKQIIMPWEEWNRREGRTHDEALHAQDHPTTFIWDRGGIEDNPAMGAEDAAHYDSIQTASDKEREVRRRGGYADFVGEAVFDTAAIVHLEQQHKQAGEDGSFAFLPDEDEIIKDKLFMAADGTPLGHRFAGVLDRRFFEWRPGVPMPDGRGRVTIFEQPDPEERDNYVIGADFAAGLVGKDQDAAIVGKRTSDGQIVQVAEAAGWWGDIIFAEVLYTLGVWYFEAFICGERQFGLPAMRRLYDEMGYSYLFHQRREDTRVRKFSELLGHHRAAGDTVIPNARLAIKKHDLVIVSGDALLQFKHYQFQARKKDEAIDDVNRSEDLITSAPAGERDDLVLAGAYMLHAAREAVHFARPKRKYAPGTFGDVFELDKTLNPRKKRKADPYAIK